MLATITIADMSRPRKPVQGPPHGSARGPRPSSPPRDVGWDNVSTWYDKLVGDEGSDYHRAVILPAALRLLAPLEGARVLDVCCGQGVLARWLADAGIAAYCGVDASPQLIEAARRRAGQLSDGVPKRFEVADLTAPDALRPLGESFDSAACLMAVHDVRDAGALFRNIASALRPRGRLVVIGLHPCFRIPRQSSWGWDEARKMQFRRLDRYQTPLEIPIATHPGRNDGNQTAFHHRSLGAYVESMTGAGFVITALEELLSHRRAAPGGHSRGENRAAEEFPIFVALVGRRSGDGSTAISGS